MSVVVSCFDGIATGYEILQNILNQPIKKYITFEIDPICNDVAKHTIPEDVLEQWGDIQDENSKTALKRQFKHIDWILCGSPCGDLSTSKGRLRRDSLEGKNSSLFWDAIDILKMYPGCNYMFENVSTMNKESWETMSHAIQDATNAPVYVSLVDANVWKPMKRKRWFWTNFHVPEVPEPSFISDIRNGVPNSLEHYLIPRNTKPMWEMDMKRAYIKNEKMLRLADEWLSCERMKNAKTVTIPCLTRSLSKKGSSSESHRHIRSVAEALLKSGRIEEWESYPRMLLLEEVLGLFGFPLDYFSPIIKQVSGNPTAESKLWSQLYDCLCNSWDIDSVTFVLEQAI